MSLYAMAMIAFLTIVITFSNMMMREQTINEIKNDSVHADALAFASYARLARYAGLVANEKKQMRPEDDTAYISVYGSNSSNSCQPKAKLSAETLLAIKGKAPKNFYVTREAVSQYKFDNLMEKDDKDQYHIYIWANPDTDTFGASLRKLFGQDSTTYFIKSGAMLLPGNDWIQRTLSPKMRACIPDGAFVIESQP